jgi:hypothetical protein
MIKLALLLFLMASKSFGLIPELLGSERECQRELIDLPSFAATHRQALRKEIEDLDKTNLTPADRKWLFKLVVLGEFNYSNNISERVINDILGMEYVRVCREVYDSLLENPTRFGQEIVWAERDSMATSSYQMIHLKFADIPFQPGETFIDIGAGFGRVGIYLAILHPGVKFIGYEIIPERVAEFNRVAKALGIGSDAITYVQDLSDPKFRMARADYYYANNPVNRETGKIIWSQLREIYRTHKYRFFGGMAGSE